MTKPFENTKEPRFDNAFIFDTPQKMFSVGADVHTYGIYTNTVVSTQSAPNPEINIRDFVSSGLFGGEPTVAFTSMRSWLTPSTFTYGFHSISFDGSDDSELGTVSADITPANETDIRYSKPIVFENAIYMWFSSSFQIGDPQTQVYSEAYQRRYRLGKKVGSTWQLVSLPFIPYGYTAEFSSFLDGKMIHKYTSPTGVPSYFSLSASGVATQLPGFSYPAFTTPANYTYREYYGNGMWEFYSPSVGSLTLRRYNYNGTNFTSDSVTYTHPGYTDFGNGLTDSSFWRSVYADPTSGKFYYALNRISTGDVKIYEYTAGTGTPALVASFSLGSNMAIGHLVKNTATPTFALIGWPLVAGAYDYEVPPKIYTATASSASYFGDTVHAPLQDVGYTLEMVRVGTNVSILVRNPSTQRIVAIPVV